ncbi:MAG: DUF3276 family protein, partial [Mucinivorans sp.]
MGYFDTFRRDKATDEAPEAQQPTFEQNTETPLGTDEVFSFPVKAGKRIYYFDVKATRGDDFYVTITESRKRPMRDGSFQIDKHKIHLYKEDFLKFTEGLEQVLNYVRTEKPDFAAAEARGEYSQAYRIENPQQTTPLAPEIEG